MGPMFSREVVLLSVVVPIYNEEELIVKFHEAVANAMESARTQWEVVYVNDGSSDSSLELLEDCRPWILMWLWSNCREIGDTWARSPRVSRPRMAPQ